MKIGVAGPIALWMLRDFFSSATELPTTMSFPLIAVLARKMREKGNELVIFALSSEVKETTIFRGDGIDAYICPMRRPRWQMADFFRRERRALTEAMRKSHCDVIHAHWTYEFGAAAILSGVPYVITAHDNVFTVLRFASHPFCFEKGLLGFPVIRNAKHLTAVSPYIAKSLNRIRRCGDVKVIGNGVSAEIFALHSRRGMADREGKREIVFASVLNYWRGCKNGRRLIEAFAAVRARLGPVVQLRMFGIEFESHGPAERWAEAYGAAEGISFCGAVANGDLLQILAEQVDILVHPSLEEAHSMATIEAMAIGIPVIAGSRSGGMPWTLDYGKAGLLVDVRSSEAIARGMETLVLNRELRQRLGVEGRKLALSEYQIDQTVERYLACLTAAAQEATV